MGLSVSHDCWSGPYSVFGEWRVALARCIGIDLSRMRGFETPEMEEAMEHYRSLGAPPNLLEALGELQHYGQISWDGVVDPLKHLLSHSDCEGSIAVELCAPIADRLEALLPLLPSGPHHWRDRASTFIAGLRAAAAAGEDVNFH